MKCIVCIFFFIFQQTAITVELIGEKKTKLCTKDQAFHGNNIDLGLKLEPNDKGPETKNPKKKFYERKQLSL